MQKSRKLQTLPVGSLKVKSNHWINCFQMIFPDEQPDDFSISFFYLIVINSLFQNRNMIVSLSSWKQKTLPAAWLKKEKSIPWISRSQVINLLKNLLKIIDFLLRKNLPRDSVESSTLGNGSVQKTSLSCSIRSDV